MADDVTLRLALPEEAFQIALMSRELIEAGLGWSWTPARVGGELRSRETVVLAASAYGRLVGFSIMQFGDETAHLNLLAVLPARQRQGIGRRMVEWLEKSARVAGIATVYLEVRAANHGGRRFYRTLGYREVAVLPRYYRGREAAVRMAHTLRRTVPHGAD